MAAGKSLSDRCFNIFNNGLCVFVLFITLYPFWYVLIMSFNDGGDAMRGGIYLVPRVFTLANYKEFLTDPKLLNSIKISVFRTVIGTFLGVLLTSLVAYGMSFKELMFRKVYLTIILIATYFSGGLIPYYVLLKQLHLFNSFLVYVIPGMLNVFLVFIFIAFFREVPVSLGESARIDGASEIRIYISIVFPVAIPAFATAALFFAVGQWNSWFDAAYFVNKTELRPLMYQMMQIINKNMTLTLSGGGGKIDINTVSRTIRVTNKSLQMAAVIISILPILSVYPFLQRYFVKGIILGAVKE